jgi:iron complex outermembrane receptor protein
VRGIRNTIQVPEKLPVLVRSVQWWAFCVVSSLAGLPRLVTAQAIDSAGQDLSTLDIDELARVRVTSVTRRPEAVAQASAAVAVISREDIRRSGVADLPEALRLLPGLGAGRVGTRDWALSARGFNQQSANKLLVLIDGRVVYSPIFAGVFWDVQRVPLEDIDRIELIRGPGAALWGANAVNGVINVVTRSAAERRGGMATLLLGTNDQAQGSLLYGAGLGSEGAVRVYGLGSTEGSSDLEDGSPAVDDWHLGQGGFRADLSNGPDQAFTVQGDVYTARGGQDLQLPLPDSPFVQALEEDLTAHGGNLLGRWTRRFSSRSDLALQAYVDYAARSQPSSFGRIGVTTLDLDLQHHFPLGQGQEIIWGLEYRRIADDVTGAFPVTFDPPERTINLVTGFVQDEIVLAQNKLAINLGAKLEHNDYTGFELQPTGRILWTPSRSTSFWGAVSRAVRTPSRVDSDIRIVAQVFDAPPVTQVVLRGSDTLRAEELVAYEAGYRIVPHERLSLDITGFYHEYHQLRSFTPLPPESSGGATTVPFIVTNDAHAQTVGGTASATVRVSSWWRVRGSYTYVNETAGLNEDAPAGAIPDASPELNPHHQIGLWSSLDLPRSLELDLLARYVSPLDVEPRVEDYLQADIQLGLRIGENVRMALIGRDLFAPRHVEFPRSGASRRAIERQLRGKASWIF